MRSPDDVYQDMERDRAVRESEIRLIENIASRAASDAERDMLFRSLILLTYAHLEGFCRFALTAYASAVNALKLPCREAVTALVAVSLRKVFAALRNVNSKHPELGRQLPDDRELHLMARERAFIDGFEGIVSTCVEIPDRAIDTKSNLNSVVLKRNLYQLGLAYPIVDQHRAKIERLLGIRNAIAHGDALKIPTQQEIKDYTEAAFDIMGFIQAEIFASLREERYKRTAEARGT